MRTTAVVLAVAVLAVMAATPLAAQESGRNHVFLELLGSGGPWSVNVERASGSLRLRAGFASWSASDLFGAGSTSYRTIPVTVAHVRGTGHHHFETGAGLTIGGRTFTSSFGGNESNRFTSVTGILGYRYQKPGPGFVFRAVITPFYGLGSEQEAYPDKGLFPSVGLSFGMAF